MPLSDALAVIGGLTVVFFAWKVWCGFREFVLSQFWQEDLRKFGQWAVVTGATSGIGKAYASELAQRGLDVVLVSRSADKLQATAKEIEESYGRKTRTIQVDFTDGHSIYPTIAKELQGLEIGILVNNVGMMYSDSVDYFLDVPDAEQRITEVINCNVLSVPHMTRLVLPDMIERGKGLIINISSLVGSRPHPLVALYSSSKSFVSFFSQCLHAEYQSKGITVQCVAPFMVSSNMTKHVENSFAVMPAPVFARRALNTVGLSSYTTGCLFHTLQSMVLRVLLPDWLRLSSSFIKKQYAFLKVLNKKSD
ncbi:hydroxysteroid (20-beta) dehydrogenase 2 [Cheilinus undulatus]|uniref:hydroxysteroid (20-beta) dehydrogenase 2 n=1 Tax=Cheilinus undulatus TaxID=241271 RepID=UPI001BD36143|nr:hydroxysteroid (20-beta) dehydrogenase 2 [Cheilinus undulatus]